MRILHVFSLLLVSCGAGVESPLQPPRSEVAEVLSGELEPGYARADAPRTLRFPDDHGPHPDFKSEWWYFTGNVRTAAGRRFGFFLTFFRVALSPDEPEPTPSAWRTRQLWMAHFAVTDVEGRRVLAAERFARGALGLAGGRSAPFAVWLEDWSARSEERGILPLRLRARDHEVAIDLVLEPGKDLVLQGEDGLSKKGHEPGNASYYYSFTRLPVRGDITVGDESHDVAGTAWIDREWSTSALGDDQVGWDWFSIQLDDGRELMWYQLRDRDGRAGATSAGTLVRTDGTVERLGPAEVELRPERTWTSPRSGVRYPVAWRLAVPAAGLDLAVEAIAPDAELDLTFRYWEGPVRIGGSDPGVGFLEMTGYR